MEPYLPLVLAALALLALFCQGRENAAMRRLHALELKAERTEIALLYVAHREESAKMFAAYREDIAQMAQRIQAPELAVVEHQQAKTEDPDPFPPTDEQLAQQQELAAFVERIEQVENESLGILS